METHYYTCEYCKVEFIPKRRKVQKFCSTSCRVRHHQEKNPKSVHNNKQLPALNAQNQNQKTKVDQMSLAGIGNAAAGVALIEIIKKFIASEASKSVTKNDLKQLENKLLKRYHLIKNMAPQPDGRKPYYDIKEHAIVYLNPNFMF